MATLNIGGTKVKVDDAFLRLSPEQQAATVEEIASNIGGGSSAAPSPAQSAYDAAAVDAGAPIQGVPQPFANTPAVSPRNAAPAVGGPDLLGATAATIGGAVNGIPVVGPAIQGFSDAILGTGAQLTGGSYDETVEGLRRRRAELAAANPVSDIAGQVAGSIAGVGGIAAIPGGAGALGLTGGLGQRVLAGGLSSAGLEAADASARRRDVASSGLIGGALGAGVPVIGAALGAGARAIGNRIGPTIKAATDPIGEAARRVGMATGRDRVAGTAMTQADEAVAKQAGVPLTNVDRGGEVTRALARSVANQSPEARAALTRVADDRFASQAPRAVQFIRRVAGGKVDDLAYQASLKEAAEKANAPLYKAAYQDPRARAVWTPEIQELMQSPAFRTAINQAETTGADRAAISGFKAVKNPFEFRPDGAVTLRTNPDGSRALPSLQFWDQVKRNIDRAIGLGKRAGDDIGDLTAIKQKLVGSLDAQVPSFKAARASAASYFGAEDALDAGKVFANNTRDLPEAKAAFAALKPAEKEAFRTGYASELVDKITDGRFRSNVIDQAFGSPAKRELFETVFGQQKARELEAYVRVEDLADKLRGALGNSTTARQLVELGIGGGAGFALSGDWTGALTGAALAKGARYANERVDAKVMEQVAKLLTSGTRADLDRAVSNASISPQWMQALESLTNALSTPVRGTALAVSGGVGSQE